MLVRFLERKRAVSPGRKWTQKMFKVFNEPFKASSKYTTGRNPHQGHQITSVAFWASIYLITVVEQKRIAVTALFVTNRCHISKIL